MKEMILLLFLLVIAVAVLVLLEFINSKDGLLRKIMIGYFAIELLVWGAGLAAFLNGYFLGAEWLWVVVLFPKAILKCYLLKYLLDKKARNGNPRL